MAIHVVSAIVENQDGKVLLARRPPGKHLAGLWEFPGGKIESGETQIKALHREFKEELCLKLNEVEFLGSYPYMYEFGEIILHVYRASAEGEPRTTEHVREFRWCRREQVEPKDLAPADVEPWKTYLGRVGKP